MTQKQYTFTGPEACLLPALRQEVKEADEIKIIVSFLMTSGIRLLIESFDSAVRAGVPVKILTGTYLNITEPDALCLLRKEFKDKIDIRLYDNKHKSFHPKAYILKK